MTKIEVFDPPMCCSTGVCGPEPDARLTSFAADLKWLQDRGVEVRRFNLAQEPMAFASNTEVKQILEATDGEGLPVVLVDGRVVTQGEYPSQERLRELVGIDGIQPGRTTGQDVISMGQLPIVGGNC
jgi:hypothetical protein